jgi:hypothetical protein
VSLRGNKRFRQLEDRTLTDTEHLTPELIAAHLARETTEAELRVAQLHLLDCASCRRDLTEAATVTADRRPRRWIAIAIPAAAAAAALFLLLPGQAPSPEGTATRGPGTEGVRQFAAVTPVEGAPVPTDSLVFRWRSEGPAVHYILTVTDENGDIVWTAATNDTSIVPPRGVSLQPGSRYFWYVDALFEDARSSTTGVREFAIQP